MSGGNAAKTVASMMIGFALAAVGLDSVTGTLRLTFGFTSTEIQTWLRVFTFGTQTWMTSHNCFL